MSDPHEHDPDPAALDELTRAFADHEPADTTVRPVRPADAAGGHPGEAGGDGEATRPSSVDRDAVDAAPDVSATDDEPDDATPADSSDDDRPDDATPDWVDAHDEPDPDPSPAVIVIDDYAGRPDAPPRSAGPERPAVGAPGDDVERVVISVDDEELPDAVYMEGSLDRGAERTIVLIEDDDTGDALQTESERDLRRGIEPRMRERRVAVKRAEGRKRLLWVVLGIVVVLLVVGVLAVLGSGWFAVRADQVSITGVVYTDEEQLQEIVDDLVGTPTLLVDTGDIEERLEAIPWVDSAQVQVDFPHAAAIEIREREAWTTYLGPDGRHRVLDREGRVLAVLDGYPIAYVLLTGPDPIDLEPGAFAPRGYAAASELAKNLTGSIRGRVESIEVTADGSNLVLHLDDGTDVRFGEARDLLNKLVRLETVLRSDEERAPGGTIDVSTSEVTL